MRSSSTRTKTESGKTNGNRSDWKRALPRRRSIPPCRKQSTTLKKSWPRSWHTHRARKPICPSSITWSNGSAVSSRARRSTPTAVITIWSTQDQTILRCKSHHHCQPAPQLTGITVGTLNHHVANGSLVGAVIGEKMLIGKQSPIRYLASPKVACKVGTEQLRKLIAEYKRAEK